MVKRKMSTKQLANLDKSRLDLINKEDARKIAVAGGEASGVAKREKKSLKEMLEFAIDVYTKRGLKNKNLSEDQKKILTEGNVLVLQLLNTALDSKTKKETQVKSIDTIFDRVYGKPKQDFGFKGDLNNMNFNKNADEMSPEEIKTFNEELKNIGMIKEIK